MSSNLLKRIGRFLFRLALVAGALALIHVALSKWVLHTIKEQIREAASSVGAVWVAEEGTSIIVDVYSGDLLVKDLRFNARTQEVRNGPMGSGRLDSLELRGLSYTGLLFHDRLKAQRVAVFAADLNIVLAMDTMKGRSDPGTFSGVDVASLDLRLSNGRLVLRDSTEIRLGEWTAVGEAVLLDLPMNEFTASKFGMRASRLRCSPMADSALSIGDVQLDGVTGEVIMNDIHFGPADVVERAKELTIERDVIAGVVDELGIHGMDMDALLQGVVSIRSVRLGPARLSIARDKLLRDEPYAHKALPARALRSWPHGAGADSLVVENLHVDYFERADALRGFGQVPFDSIVGVAVNVHHETTDTLVLHATARAFGRTPLVLELNTHIGDSTDLFQLEARVGRLPFASLNKVLAPLTGIATPEGRLDTLILRMDGRDRQASARCWMRYDGLKLDRRVRKNRALDPFLNGLLNAVVKRDRTGEKDGDGWEHYTWERKRDRSVFNYLWIGVREGAKASMLPKVLVDQVSK